MRPASLVLVAVAVSGCGGTPAPKSTVFTPTDDPEEPAPRPAPAHRPVALAPGPATPAADPVAAAAQPCTHARAEADLRRAAKGADPAAGAVDAAFERCVFDRVTDCQYLLDGDAGKAVACWDRAPWPELPVIMSAPEIAKTGMCLHELKAVEDDVMACAKRPVAERDGCIAPYLDYTPSCPLLDAAAGWRAFAAQGHLDKDSQKASEEARRQAERAAKAAKEAERCLGSTTLDFTDKLKADPKTVAPKGCKYAVAGRVTSSNNVYVELVHPTTGGSLHLLRTREPFAEGASVDGRVAIYEKMEPIEMADGTAQPLPVFKLMPR